MLVMGLCKIQSEVVMKNVLGVIFSFVDISVVDITGGLIQALMHFLL